MMNKTGFGNKKHTMKTQNFKNHSRLVFGYHQVGLLSAFGLFIWSIVNLVNDCNSINLYLSIFTFVFIIIAYYVRSFALGNQDRIIRMEMRYRYHLLTGKRFENIESQLDIKQIVALRFASDEELESLITKAINEKLSPKMIKLEIKNWQGDYQRI